MQSTTAAQLLEATGGTLLFGSAAQCVNEAETDSRQCRPGMLFVPLIAARDGHDFIAPALAAGAEGTLCSRVPEKLEEGSFTFRCRTPAWPIKRWLHGTGRSFIFPLFKLPAAWARRLQKK